MKWWFCLIHLTVEHGPGCPDESRIGPFETETQAQLVLERMKARNALADEDDD